MLQEHLTGIYASILKIVIDIMMSKVIVVWQHGFCRLRAQNGGMFLRLHLGRFIEASSLSQQFSRTYSVYKLLSNKNMKNQHWSYMLEGKRDKVKK